MSQQLKTGGEGWIRTIEGLRRQISRALKLPRGLDYLITMAHNSFRRRALSLCTFNEPNIQWFKAWLRIPLKVFALRAPLNSPAFPSEISSGRCIFYSLVHLAAMVPHQNRIVYRV